jgi:hypothetical protein
MELLGIGCGCTIGDVIEGKVRISPKSRKCCRNDEKEDKTFLPRKMKRCSIVNLYSKFC